MSKKMGRPSKYDPKFCDLLVDHMSKGFSFESFAGLINVRTQTIYNWLKSEPNFLEAKSIAFERSRLFWEDVGIKHIKNIYQGDNLNTTLWIFNMKNRFGWKDVKEDVDPAEKTASPSLYKIHDRNKPNSEAG
jgi:hypothetical protein